MVTGLGDAGQWPPMGTGFLLEAKKHPGLSSGDVCTTVNTLKTTELYALKEYVVWYVNYASIPLLGSATLDKWLPLPEPQFPP